MTQQSKPSILTVDDQSVNLKMYSLILKDLNVNIIQALSGREVLELAENYDLALIIMDVKMPGMDGFETARLLKKTEKTKDIPIIFATAFSQDSDTILKGVEG